jgi:hypothetical protein
VPPLRLARRTAHTYRDRDERATNAPAEAASGEIVEFDDHGAPLRRTRFFLRREELPWLPVTEAAFLLWVLTALVVAWVAVAAYLALT